MPIDRLKLKIFFEDRPAISVAAIEREAGLPKTKIKEFLNGNQNLSEDQDKRLQNVLANYGSFPKPSGLGALLNDSIITSNRE